MWKQVPRRDDDDDVLAMFHVNNFAVGKKKNDYRTPSAASR
jgi:hypothetical protein